MILPQLATSRLKAGYICLGYSANSSVCLTLLGQNYGQPAELSDHTT